MKHNNLFVWMMAIVMASITVTSCSDDPQWADPEAHEKTEQLQKQYTPFIIGTWHIEYIKEKMLLYESLTFNEDGSLKGMRKWQGRELVAIDGQEQYTDWKDVDGENGAFTGIWKLMWSRETELSGNRLMLTATFDGERDWTSPVAYGLNARFINADETTLSIEGGIIHNSVDDSTIYSRGNGKPSF
jgi:hypothetical protein